MKRRNFLSWMSFGWLASLLPTVIAACSSNKQTTASPARSDGFQEIGTVAELDQNGQILNKELAAGPVLVIRNPTNSNTLNAVNPTCTHRNCTVSWQVNQKEFVCPCHDSKFAPDGKVLQGPAKKPLPTYQAKIEGNSILVKVS